ncbi:MAG TPA: HlyD family efflux transporter periplasmic adaptor subunit [Polyangia bacterium]
MRQAQLGAARARHELEAAQAALPRPVAGAAADGEAVLVRAPVRGRVLRLLQEHEGPVAAGAPLVEVGDATALELCVDVLTSEAVRMRPGAAVALLEWGGPGALHGRVRAIEPSAYTKVSALGVEEQRVNVIVDPAPAAGAGAAAGWALLGDGFHVEAHITVAERENALKVPAGALFRAGGRWAAFTIQGRRAALRHVETGAQGGGEVEITAGLREGDRVILHPGDLLEEGTAVRAR